MRLALDAASETLLYEQVAAAKIDVDGFNRVDVFNILANEFILAYGYGTPQVYAGFAFGIDRLTAILAGEDNIREDIENLFQPPDLSGIDLSNPALDVCEAIVALFEAITLMSSFQEPTNDLAPSS